MNYTISDDVVPYWTVHCIPGGAFCNEDQKFVVIVTGSEDVVLRYENTGAGNGNVARVNVKNTENVMAQLMVIDGLPVLELTATDDILDVVVLRKERVQRVVNRGSGDVTVDENVLVTSGSSLTISAVGSGDVLVKSSSLVVDELSVSSQGSGRIQASFSEFDVKTASMQIFSSGDITMVASSNAAVDTASLTVLGSGSLCVTSVSSLDINHLKIDMIGNGDISLGPQGSCQDAEISTGGAGIVDVGGIQCHNVNVDLLGSGNVFVQATDSLFGDVYGSGHLKYYGGAPHSIDNINYMGLVTATPASNSYHPAECKVKPFLLLQPTDSPGALTNSSCDTEITGRKVIYDVTVDQSNILYLAVVVFIVALVLRWFNESRRQAREEQRQSLVGAER